MNYIYTIDGKFQLIEKFTEDNMLSFPLDIKNMRNNTSKINNLNNKVNEINEEINTIKSILPENGNLSFISGDSNDWDNNLEIEVFFTKEFSKKPIVLLNLIEKVNYQNVDYNLIINNITTNSFKVKVFINNLNLVNIIEGDNQKYNSYVNYLINNVYINYLLIG